MHSTAKLSPDTAASSIVDDDAFVEGGAVRQIGERIMMRHMRDALLVALALGEVVDDADEVLRLPVRARHRQSRGGDDARAVAGSDDRVFVKEGGLARGDQFLIFGFDLFARCDCGMTSAAVLPSMAERSIAEIFLGGAVDQQIPQIGILLHDDRRRHVLDDRIEERAGLLEFALGPLALGNVLVRRHPAAACIG